MNKMTIACLTGLAFAGGLSAWATINWYKGRGSRDKKSGPEKLLRNKNMTRP